MNPEQIQLISTIISTIVAVISIIIAILTLRQTSKITRESNKAYISITLHNIPTFGQNSPFIVIKNQGNSNAIIKSIKCSRDYSFNIDMPYDNFIGHTLAPKESIVTYARFKDDSPFTITITYTQGLQKKRDTTTETFTINPQFLHSIVSSDLNNDEYSKDVNGLRNLLIEYIKQNY